MLHTVQVGNVYHNLTTCGTEIHLGMVNTNPVKLVMGSAFQESLGLVKRGD